MAWTTEDLVREQSTGDLLDVFNKLDTLTIQLEHDHQFDDAMKQLFGEWGALESSLRECEAWDLLEPTELVVKACSLASDLPSIDKSTIVDFLLTVNDYLRQILAEEGGQSQVSQQLLQLSDRLAPLSQVQCSAQLEPALRDILNCHPPRSQATHTTVTDIVIADDNWTDTFWHVPAEYHLPVMQLVRQTSEILGVQTRYWRGRDQFMMPFVLRINQLAGQPESRFDLMVAVYLHDLGMARITLPRRSMPITDDMRVMVRQHPLYAGNMAYAMTRSHTCAQIIYQHHERPDGQGYGMGLRQDKIRAGAMMLGVLDMFCAIAKRANHRDISAIAGILNEMRPVAGQQIDRDVFNLFEQVLATQGFIGPNISVSAVAHYMKLVVEQE